MRLSTPTDTDRVISQYLAAWNAVDTVTRMRHLQASWSETALFRDPMACQVGRSAMHDHIARCQASYPGCRFIVTGSPIHYLDQIHFTWAVLDTFGSELLTGSHYGELDATGRIARLVGFFKSPAARSSSSISASL
ncbi:nuclear transport factor 2 family protein [Piscinibacter sp.]|uniref:nuclear transport factor 2 family protein n=1 Tax=Piscinibacter sp. TaxID=1903157 RepID=UPI002BA5F562|nr:nuclear transport factor 2 family protein [Albitalea sp.]HUG21074.1 nuclear transport factor 2 family protein [Albitalea sp.]